MTAPAESMQDLYRAYEALGAEPGGGLIVRTTEGKIFRLTHAVVSAFDNQAADANSPFCAERLVMAGIQVEKLVAAGVLGHTPYRRRRLQKVPGGFRLHLFTPT